MISQLRFLYVDFISLPELGSCLTYKYSHHIRNQMTKRCYIGQNNCTKVRSYTQLVQFWSPTYHMAPLSYQEQFLGTDIRVLRGVIPEPCWLCPPKQNKNKNDAILKQIYYQSWKNGQERISELLTVSSVLSCISRKGHLKKS